MNDVDYDVDKKVTYRDDEIMINKNLFSENPISSIGLTLTTILSYCDAKLVATYRNCWTKIG